MTAILAAWTRRRDGPGWSGGRIETPAFGSVNVRVLVVSGDSGWYASAAFASPMTNEEREGWDFLRTLSPYFALRFEGDEDATIDIRVDEPSESELTLTAA